MTRWVRRIGLVLLVLAAAPASASAVVVHHANGQFLGVSPHRGVSTVSIPGSVAAAHAGSPSSLAPTTGNLSYHSGPVIHSSTPYLIFWTPSGHSLPSGSESLIERYFTDVATDNGGASNVFGAGQQWTDTAGFESYKQTFSSASQAVLDTAAYPTTGRCTSTAAAYPICLTDAQLETEINRVISLDGLPKGTGANAPIYFIVTPSDVNICDGAGSCSNNTFCAYHSAFSSGGGTVLYAAIPFFLSTAANGQNPKACQFDGNSAVQEPNGNLADVAISYISHEYNETLSDPLGTGWWDSSSGNEDGDNCAFFGSSVDPAHDTNPDAWGPTLGGSAGAGTLYDQLINGHQYYTQSEWSNGDVNCELQPSTGSITPSFTVPTPESIPAGAAASFDPTASTSTNTVTSESWSYGDGTQSFHAGSSLTNGSHSYAAGGSYQVTLTLVDDRGNVSSATQQVVIDELPTAAFTISPGQHPVGPVSFDASASSDPDGSIASYAWNFGDGGTDTGATPVHSYGQAGTYTVTLTVTDSDAGHAQISHQVTVGSAPTAAFSVSPSSTTERTPVTFNGAFSSDPDPGIPVTSYAWSFGDGTTGAGPVTSHAYAAPGAYTVSLVVTNSLGMPSTGASHQVIVIDEQPTASFGPPAGLAGATATFNGGGSDPDGLVVSYSWSFGDGAGASGPNVTHAFARAGTFTVTLTVRDSSGASAMISHPVVILPSCRVPSVKGKSRAAAARALRGAGCVLGNVKAPRRHLQHRRLVVKTQSIRGGTIGASGTKVNLTLRYR